MRDIPLYTPVSWNHRVIRKKREDGGFYFEVHEVYYNTEDEIVSWTIEPASPFGETIEELKEEVERFKKATEKPILEEVARLDPEITKLVEI